MLTDLKEIISIDTTLAPQSAIDAPFGQNLRNALDWFLNKASSYGLKVGEDKGFCGWADYGDSDKPIIGILCHADIVPCGEGWDTNPLELVEKDGFLYGRGVADDKGPLAVMLHLLKRLKDEKIELDHRVRLIVGLNEESGSACIKRYTSTQEIPRVSLVPDADFPVINSEKGILHARCAISIANTQNNLLSFNAGERANIVPGSATFVVCKEYHDLIMANTCLPSSNFTVVGEGENYRFTTCGTAGHASTPDKGDNAIYKALELLSHCDEVFKKLYDGCGNYGCTLYEKLFVTDKSGSLTFNIGMASLTEGTLYLTYDFRLPLALDYSKVVDALGSYYGEVKVLHYAPNLFVDENSPLIKSLLAVYRSVTGEKNAEPLQIGGGTYARELPNAVAFGPTFAGRETNIHNRNENILKDDLILLGDIYYKAVLELDKIF